MINNNLQELGEITKLFNEILLIDGKEQPKQNLPKKYILCYEITIKLENLISKYHKESFISDIKSNLMDIIEQLRQIPNKNMKSYDLLKQIEDISSKYRDITANLILKPQDGNFENDLPIIKKPIPLKIEKHNSKASKLSESEEENVNNADREDITSNINNPNLIISSGFNINNKIYKKIQENMENKKELPTKKGNDNIESFNINSRSSTPIYNNLFRSSHQQTPIYEQVSNTFQKLNKNNSTPMNDYNYGTSPSNYHIFNLQINNFNNNSKNHPGQIYIANSNNIIQGVNSSFDSRRNSIAQLSPINSNNYLQTQNINFYDNNNNFNENYKNSGINELLRKPSTPIYNKPDFNNSVTHNNILYQSNQFIMSSDLLKRGASNNERENSSTTASQIKMNIPNFSENNKTKTNLQNSPSYCKNIHELGKNIAEELKEISNNPTNIGNSNNSNFLSDNKNNNKASQDQSKNLYNGSLFSLKKENYPANTSNISNMNCENISQLKGVNDSDEYSKVIIKKDLLKENNYINTGISPIEEINYNSNLYNSFTKFEKGRSNSNNSKIILGNNENSNFSNLSSISNTANFNNSILKPPLNYINMNNISKFEFFGKNTNYNNFNHQYPMNSNLFSTNINNNNKFYLYNNNTTPMSGDNSNNTQNCNILGLKENTIVAYSEEQLHHQNNQIAKNNFMKPRIHFNSNKNFEKKTHFLSKKTQRIKYRQTNKNIKDNSKQEKRNNANILGLKEIAKEVNELIIEEGTTNYKDISEKLVSKHNFNPNDAKNIKRRIYDALNVIKAVRKINKSMDTETVKLEKEYMQLVKKLEFAHNKNAIKQEEINKIESKKKIIQELIIKNQKNERMEEVVKSKKEEKFYFPFLIIEYKDVEKNEIDVLVTENKKKCIIKVNNEIDIKGDFEFIQNGYYN